MHPSWPAAARACPSERQWRGVRSGAVRAAARARQAAMQPPHRSARRSPAFSFDHLVGPREEGRWDGKAKGPSGLQVDDELELRRLQDWQLGRSVALKNA